MPTLRLNGQPLDYKRTERLGGGRVKVYWTQQSRMKSTVHDLDDIDFEGGDV